MTEPLFAVGRIHPLATTNAILNATATALLIAGYVLIRRGRERAHRRTMLAAFLVSVVFLTCYLAYHVWPVGAESTRFLGQGGMRVIYLVILVSHIVLAMLVPPLAVTTIVLGLRGSRTKHRRVARITFPIWLYVSITGVLVYLMLYHLYPPSSGESIIGPV